MKILITGSAGFIGFHVTIALLKQGHEVLGIDNINEYYDINLKYHRLLESGIERIKISWNKEVHSNKYDHYSFVRLNLEDKQELMAICKRINFDAIINLAAQAGVRYSILNPDAYVQSNLVGFLNVLEVCRNYKISHLIYASSSSVYGLNEQIPFSVKHNVNHPVSLYAATKKANELMAHSYSYLYNIPTTGLRFFTVYGPWGRPDMACFIFTNAIMANKPIHVFNNGKMKRDFTYIDDVVAGVIKVLEKPAYKSSEWNGKQPDPSCSCVPYRIYNIGNNKPVDLMSFIHELERNLGKKAIIELEGMQPGDVTATWADIHDLASQFNYRPDTTIQSGLKNFITWYKKYYGIKKVKKTVGMETDITTL
ncbi:NAD-dependent epimerase [Flavisolibacter ginsengisoli]|jgi:UDP-glucuronate 4-epimerase|uniref:UDP-glucuronate 4-epimerase n=1 Tax=Flavisolibacter ginsengisoli DSM 18119 TaxID=1121884 RepID=A0A1M5BAA3_9BACT|nr:NAD-dependent epimerase [Flavisolibacter ginsengisoli]SHF39378.1 UDP-glucuronate 4-epimerase [Flavisolibacter ginsengisoli DSM 18119]